MEDLIYKPGDRIGNYQVLGFIGGGGFSAVYKVRDLNDSRKAAPSALKISRLDFHTVPRELRVELNARMWREQDELGQLEHQNIVRVYEWGLHDGKVWYAMELLQGPTLGRYLAEERRTFLELMLTFRQVVEAVTHCHENGVIHRDLKPSNLIVTTQKGPVVQKDDEDRSGGPDRRTPSEKLMTRLAVLIDFGIGHMVGAAPVTAPGALLGTVQYLPPWYVREILAALDGKRPEKPYKAEPRDDVYQLAVSLYWLLTGMLPVRTPGEQRLQLLEEIRDVVPVHPRLLNPEAPEALSELAMRCLDKHGTGIPPDGAAFRAALLEALHKDGEALAVKAPELHEGQETQLGMAQFASLLAAKAPALHETVSAPASVLAEAEGLTPSGGAVAPSGGPTLLSTSPETSTPTQQANTPPKPAADAVSDGIKHLIRIERRTFGMVAAAVVLFLMLFYRLEKHLEATQAQSVAASGDAAQALRLATAARVPGPSAVAAVPPPTGHIANILGGLKMPDKPDPIWLRPGKDGVCRNQETGEELRTQVVIRGTCWEVTGRMPGTPSCPSFLFDPPPEVLKDQKLKHLHDACFRAWVLVGGSSVQPRP